MINDERSFVSIENTLCNVSQRYSEPGSFLTRDRESLVLEAQYFGDVVDNIFIRARTRAANEILVLPHTPLFFSALHSVFNCRRHFFA